MSRMAKFLRQRCTLESYKLDDDRAPKLNEFGELIYNTPVTVKCRREQTHRDIQTNNGNIVRSVSRYYLDGSRKIEADYRLDGKVVLGVESYVNSAGEVEGYEVYV